MTRIHGGDNCDYRDFQSSENCDLRDSNPRDFREYQSMADPQIELKRWFREKTAPHGVKARLAEATDYTPTQISRMRNLDTDDPKKRQEIPIDMIMKAARFFGELPPGFEGMTQWVDDITVPTKRGVPLVGYVGAGAEAHFYAAADDPDEFVDAPDGATADTRAVEIRGESLGTLFDRWLVFYDDRRSPVTPDLIGRLCIVGLYDGRVLVKRIRRSKTAGLYHLDSNIEGTIVDVEIEWAARVKNMVPRS